MADIERAEPNVLYGKTRANQAYRDKFLEQLNQAYAENLITRDERDARAAFAHHEPVSTERLRELVSDLPSAAKPAPRPSARARVMLYVLAGAAAAGLAIGGPIGITQIHPHQFDWATMLGAVLTAIAGIALLIISIFSALTDEAIGQEYGA